MKGVTESLAGRVSFVDVAGLGLAEVGAEQHRRLWWRGGFPVPYLAEMDVFGYPLRSDHFGTSEQVLGEAMAAGVVPVVMDNPAEKLIVTPTPGPYPTGIRCRYQDDYPKAVEWIYGLPEMRRRISENSRSCAKELYSLDTMIRKWDEVFAEMMEKPKTVRHTL